MTENSPSMGADDRIYPVYSAYSVRPAPITLWMAMRDAPPIGAWVKKPHA